ncbi:hypothetical protein [Coralloluteibacterium stylophorae]|uniref:Lipoprotein n=1 Tax=Coralloluteibacterium stylophorae TaxID=1776034 RepID=A0A8J7VTV7_9GAMM|nr:hypothetical protein [Coralloluteibacterium stylophorae]MBS7456507.1 hypothetical protein [Coralloluteibacterium stylophorae]
MKPFPLPSACLLTLAVAACATTPPQDPQPPADAPRVAGIALGFDSLADVAERFGASQRIARGNQPEDTATETCYRVSDGAGGELELRFAATRPQPGGEPVVTQARVMPATAALAAGCAVASVDTASLLPHGLALAMPPAAVEAALAGFTRTGTDEGEVYMRPAHVVTAQPGEGAICAQGGAVDSVAVIAGPERANGYVIGRIPAC